MFKFLIFFLFFFFAFRFIRRLLTPSSPNHRERQENNRRKRKDKASLEDSKFNIDAETVDYEIIDEPIKKDETK